MHIRGLTPLRHGQLALLGLVVAGCYHAAPDRDDTVLLPPIRDVSYASEKEEMIRLMERRMNRLVGVTQAELATIRDGLSESLDSLRPPTKLLAVERTFRGYAAADQERFDAEIKRLVEVAVAQTEAIIGRPRRPAVEELIGTAQVDAFRIAAEVGGDGQGAGYGFVSGVQEVDEMALVSVELLQGYADVEGLHTLGEIRRGEMLELNQAFRHDVQADELAGHADRAKAALVGEEEGRSDRVGRLLLFESGVVRGLRMDQQENVVAVVAFQNDRLPVDHDIGLIQARRHRVSRGGMVVLDSPWQLDPQTPNRDGVPRMRDDLVDMRFVASEAFIPSLNVDHSSFERLRDFTVIYDFKTGVLDRRTGEIIGAVSWQTKWIVSMNGGVAMVDGVPPTFDASGDVLLDLIAQGTAAIADASGRQKNPSDRFAQMRDPGFDAIAAPVRDLPGGKRARVVEVIGNDHYRVPRDGRRYLLAHRLALLARDVRFFQVRDGGRGRFVLTITHIDDDSAVNDLGLRSGDDLLSVNGVDIESFSDLWQVFAEQPREPVYEVRLNRAGAQRRLTFQVEGAPAEGQLEEVFDENPTDEMMDRLARLFEQEQKTKTESE